MVRVCYSRSEVYKHEQDTVLRASSFNRNAHRRTVTARLLTAHKPRGSASVAPAPRWAQDSDNGAASEADVPRAENGVDAVEAASNGDVRCACWADLHDQMLTCNMTYARCPLGSWQGLQSKAHPSYRAGPSLFGYQDTSFQELFWTLLLVSVMPECHTPF